MRAAHDGRMPAININEVIRLRGSRRRKFSRSRARGRIGKLRARGRLPGNNGIKKFIYTPARGIYMRSARVVLDDRVRVYKRRES